MDILSIKYKTLVQQLIKPLQENKDFSGISIAILLRSAKYAWLTSTPQAAIEMIESGYYRGTLFLNYEFCTTRKLFFPDEQLHGDDLKEKINEIFLKYNLHRAYAFTRYCDDCCVVVGYNVNYEERNYIKIYHETIDKVEQVLINFLDKAIDVYIENLPELKTTRFATDKNYRDKILQNREQYQDNPILSNAELEVLYWSSRGKTAEEIAMILNLSLHTINTYRKKAIEKLETKNITHAVYLALSKKYIV